MTNRLITPDSQDIEWDFKWFTPQEIMEKSQHNSFVLTPKLEQTLRGLDILRTVIGQPMVVTNACRFAGSKTSQHFFRNFNAIDVWTRGYDSEDLMKVVEDLNIFTGRGLYPHSNGFIHIDCRNGLYPENNGNISRWYRDKDGNYHGLEDFVDFIK